MANRVLNPLSFFAGLDGAPLENGKIYIGDYGQDPESNPKAVFFDANLSSPAAQPIRTISGYPASGSSAAEIFTDGPFSITVRTSADELVFTALSYDAVSRGIEPFPDTAYGATQLAALPDGTIGTLAGVAYLVDSTATGALSARNFQGVNGIVPYGTPRPQHFGGTDADSVERCFDWVGARGGGEIYFSIGEYDSPYRPPEGEGYFDEPPVMTHDNITLIFEKMGEVNDENTPTALVNGSIWKGSLFFAADNFNWQNLCIDVGVDWCAANNGGEAQEGLISINRYNAGYAAYPTIGDEPPRIGGKNRGDALILCKGTGRRPGFWDPTDPGDVSDVHAALLENDDGAICHGVFRTILGGAGWVLKSSNCEYAAVKVERCFKYGQGLLKSENYSAANDNRVHFLRSVNFEHTAPVVTDRTQYQQNAGRLEAATADCTGNVISIDGSFGLINGWEFYALSGFACENNTLHCLGPINECYSYCILGNGVGTSSNTVYNARGTNPLAGAYALDSHHIRLIDAEFTDARQYSFRANAGGSLELLNPRSETDGFGHLLARGEINIIGEIQTLGTAALEAGTGTITGINESALLLSDGQNIVIDGDCESTDGWDNVNGSTMLEIVAGGQVGNALEITRIGAPQGYCRQRLAVDTGKKYNVSIFFKNGTAPSRLFLSKATFADGYYTGGTFVALNNASWTRYETTLVAETEVLFITLQVGGVAPGACMIDEVEIKAVPLTVGGDVLIKGGVAATLSTYANNAAAIAGGLVAGDFYTTGGDPAEVCVVT
ncbi:hypothetical protein ACJ5NV_06405 [Loktanella agnita]|uniref:hypothetical protein n=1 Tax=Loktanella agnita TaxID=287097 RepID=UPI0039882713